MAITAGNTRLALLMLASITTLNGCGLTQKVSDGTVAITKSIFYKQVKTLHLDIQARDAVNNNATGAPLATVVRIYQLKVSVVKSPPVITLDASSCWRP